MSSDSASPRPASLPIRPKDPKRIGQWKLGRTIGEGGQGRVRLARNGRTGQMAAVKIMHKSMLSMKSFDLQRMAEEEEKNERYRQREVVAMKLINHPNIMRLYEVWDTPDQLYLILEHVQGGELFDFLTERVKLEPMEALKYFQQIIYAMDYCHRFNIAHRDLKPENILMDADNNIKVADFGLAAWTTGDYLSTSCGSPHYAAPEVLRGDDYNAFSIDIWSCGVILFALLTGGVPWDDDDQMSVTDHVLYSPLKSHKIEHDQARNLVEKMLTKDPSKRYTMSQIMKHPYFNEAPPASQRVLPPTLEDIALPVDPDDIDENLLGGLRCMWNQSDESLLAHLSNDETNWQKGMYFLLSEHRQQAVQRFEEEEARSRKNRQERLQAKRDAKGALRRTKSVGDITPSASLLPPRDGPPTPRRAAGRNNTSVSSSESSIAWVDLSGTVAQRYEDISSRELLHKVNFGPLSRPLAMSPILSFMKDISDVQARDQDADLSALGLQVRPLNIVKRFRPRPRRSTIDALLAEDNEEADDTWNEDDVEDIEDGYLIVDKITPVKPPRKMLNLFGRRDKLAISQPKRAQSLKKRLGMKRGFTHPPVLETIPGNEFGLSLSPSPENATPVTSPALVSTPRLGSPSSSASRPNKRSLAVLLKLKPPTVTIHSPKDCRTARNDCRTFSLGMGVLVVASNKEGPGVLKCRLEMLSELGLVTEAVKAVKFRVQIYPSQDAKGKTNLNANASMMGSTLVFAHEKGSLESLKIICERLKQELVPDEDENATPEQVLWGSSPTSETGFFGR